MAGSSGHAEIPDSPKRCLCGRGALKIGAAKAGTLPKQGRDDLGCFFFHQQLLAPRKTNADETPSRRAGGGSEAEDKTSRGKDQACCDDHTVKKRTNAEVKYDEEIDELYYKEEGLERMGKKGGVTHTCHGPERHMKKKCCPLVFCKFGT